MSTDAPLLPRVRLVLSLPGFFAIKHSKLTVETGPVTGLVYFLSAGKVVAIGEPLR